MSDLWGTVYNPEKEIIYLETLLSQLEHCEEMPEKLRVLDLEERVSSMLMKLASYGVKVSQLSADQEYVLKALAAIGQVPSVFAGTKPETFSEENFLNLIKILLDVEKFYDSIGGMIGYHLEVIRRIAEGVHGRDSSKDTTHYFPPSGIDLSHHNDTTRSFVRQGVEQLPTMAELYPVGGAGDRLGLTCVETDEPLPAAVMIFEGRTLLEGLFRDVQAREYLYYKLFGEQVTTPIAMMTSHEKDNHEYILSTIEENGWFGRPKESVTCFVQHCVPVLSLEGHWLVEEPMVLLLKPGGHGMIWKEAKDQGVFDWYQEQKRKHLLVRQINNPIAGTDDALLAFTGIGCSQEKEFGFASCQRRVRSPEGVNVFSVKSSEEGYECAITNIEYTEFTKKGIADVPVDKESEYSEYPANTNILFADIDSIRRHLRECPIPGMIINMKSTFRCLQETGVYREETGGRLESTMQNIADVIVDIFPNKVSSNEGLSLKTFLTYNLRRKTISVTKCSYDKGVTINGTPPGCFHEKMQNHYELLTSFCGMSVPEAPTAAGYLREGPSFVFNFNPALGPSWEVIAQKIRGGRLAHGAELQLEIAEVDLENVDVDGSLLVEAKNTLGEITAEGLLKFSPYCGKCTLKDVKVNNAGINFKGNNVFWQGKIERNEALRIVIHGNGEFHAEGVTFEGEQYIEVPDGVRVVATSEDGGITFQREDIKRQTWSWRYHFGEGDKIMLEKV